jgi:hypothetical protein
LPVHEHPRVKSIRIRYNTTVMYIAILGRQPALGLAELERIYGADNVTPLPEVEAALLDVEVNAIDLRRMGGSIKLAKVLTVLDNTNWRQIEKYLAKSIPEHIRHVPEGKFRLGLSVYGLTVSPNDINATNLRLKKVIKNLGRSVRVIPNSTPALNSAQVLHNQLTGATGWELLAIRRGHKTILAQTIAEQNIEAYTARDQARPARDAFVGMLPPKLAQIMINLALPPSTNSSQSTNLSSAELSPSTPSGVTSEADETIGRTDDLTLLDPFCGTGVILQEASLMGYNVYGTDLADKMIDYSDRNLKWLSQQFDVHNKVTLEQADAMTARWENPIDAIVCESYLGQPFSAPPSPAKLAEVTKNCEHIISEFLKNLGDQIKSGTPLCIAVPAWHDRDGGFTHLPLTHMIGTLGYRRHTFKNIRDEELLYFRPDQVVARELLVITKN